MGNHLFVIFAVLDVSFAVNSCINHSFFYIFRCINNTYEKEAIAITNTDAAVNSIANTADGTTDGNY